MVVLLEGGRFVFGEKHFLSSFLAFFFLLSSSLNQSRPCVYLGGFCFVLNLSLNGIKLIVFVAQAFFYHSSSEQ